MKTTYINTKKALTIPQPERTRVRSGWRQATLTHKNVKGYSRKNFRIEMD